jgi:hypothetical protein
MAITYVKQPSESRVYALNLKNLMAKGDTIASITSVTATPTSELTFSDQTISGTKVLVRIADGVAGTKYKVTAVVATTGTDVLEMDGSLEVAQL